jgi:uncharacterized protein YqeY
MSEIKHRVTDAVKSAMKSGDRTLLGTLRLISAAIKQVEVDERRELSDADLLGILGKMVKQRRESIAQYEAAGRSELAEREQAEIAVISEFLPQPLAQSELEAMVDEAVAETGAQSVRDMGAVMALLRERVRGRADMGAVSGLVKARLAGG